MASPAYRVFNCSADLAVWVVCVCVCARAHPSSVDCTQDIGEPLLTEMQQHHQVKAAADEIIVFRLRSEKKKLFS